MELTGTRNFERVPIDKGYAWVVCIGCSLISVVLSGSMRIWGLFTLHWVEQFELSPFQALSVTGVTTVVMAVLCPVMCALGNVYSERKVLVVGGMITAIGMIGTGFSRQLVHLYVCFGLLNGIGYATSMAAVPIIVGYYFDKKRAMGNGFAMAGASLGQFLFPAVVTGLFELYDYRSALIIFGALCLNIIPAAMLCRPMSFFTRRLLFKKDFRKSKIPKISMESSLLVKEEQCCSTRQSFFQRLGQKNSSLALVYQSPAKSTLQLSANTFPRISSPNIPPVGSRSFKEGSNEKIIHKHCPFHHEAMHKVVLHEHHYRKLSIIPTYNFDEHDLCSAPRRLRVSCHDVAPLQNVPHHFMEEIEEMESESGIAQDETHESFQVRRNVPLYNTLMTLFCSCCPVDEDPKVIPLYDWGLLRNRLLVIYLVASLLMSGGYFNIFVLLPSYAEEEGLSNKTIALLLSVLGVSDFIGRILSGIIGDKRCMQRYNMVTIILCVMGGLTIALPYLPIKEAYFIAYCFLFGLFGGAYSCLINVVCVDLLGIGEVSGAFGLSIMFGGLFYLPLTLLAGRLHDVNNNYVLPIVVCGGCLLAGAMTLVSLNYLEHAAYRDEHKKNKKPPLQITELYHFDVDL